MVNLKIDNLKLKVIKTIKYFGVVIDEKLTFEEYLNYLCKKALKKIRVLSRMRQNLYSRNTSVVYNTMILQHI